MTWIERLSLFSELDYAGVILLFVSWILIGWWIDNPGKRPSVSKLMSEYRREWMRQMVLRDNRIFDSNILSMLRQGAAFFASACMIAIGGTFAMIGNAEVVAGLGNDIVLTDDPEIVWEIKLGIILIFLVNAFLKFVWANRLFGYCAVLVAAVPNDSTDPLATPRAEQAGEINISAARAFNRGLRSIYFAMAATAWAFGAATLIVAVSVTVAMLLRREFISRSRGALIQGLGQK